MKAQLLQWKKATSSQHDEPTHKKPSETSVFGNSAASILKAQLLQWQRATSSQHDEPTHKKLLKPVCLAIVRFRPTESTALALIEGAFYQITSSL